MGGGNNLIELTGVNVILGGRTLLDNVEWRIGTDENWAVLGPNGSGKTTLLRTLRGEIWPHFSSRGKRLYNFDGDVEVTPIEVRRRIAFVSADLQEAYLRRNNALTGGEAILTGYYDSLFLYEQPGAEKVQHAEEVMERLRIAGLRAKPVREMSTGQARKILIARALVAKPRLLLLDEFLNGLDLPSRAGMIDFLRSLLRPGTQLVYTTHHASEVLPEIDRVINIDAGRARVLPTPPVHVAANDVYTIPELDARTDIAGDQPPLIEMEHCDVYLGRRKVLHGINWTLRAGEHWAIVGHNGAGKSTLLKLVTGDEYPALGGILRRDGTLERRSIWDIKSQIGIVSSDLQAAYRYDISAEDVVVSGFFSTIGLYEAATEDQRIAAHHWMNRLGLLDVAARDFATLSYGERRRLLIARALVHSPRILILDEPTSGLDAPSRRDVLEMFEKVSRAGVSLLYVTHLMNELVPTINRAMLLHDGRIIHSGPAQDVLTKQNIRAALEE